MDVDVLYRAAQRQSAVYHTDAKYWLSQAATRGAVRTITAGNTFAACYDDGDSRMLVCRGSDDWRDWLNNAFCVPMRGFHNLHTGMTMHARELDGAIKADEILDADDPRPLYIVGQSLGGAVAQILPLLHKRYEPEHVITFGAPRIFKGDYHAAKYDFPLLQICMEWDVVPFLPLWWDYQIFGNWRHPHNAEVWWFNALGTRFQPGPWHFWQRNTGRTLDAVRQVQTAFDRRQFPSLRKILNSWHDHRKYASLISQDPDGMPFYVSE